MSAILIDTRSVPLVVTNAANVTAATITLPIPKTTPPSGDGVILLGHGGQETASAVKIVFFGVGSDTNTFQANVYGWEVQKATKQGDYDLWVPTLLASFSSIELDSGMPGVVNADIPAADYFATAITLGTGNSGISVEVVSPGHGADIAHAIVDTKGCRFLEVRFGTGSSATSCNALVKRL